MHDVKLFTPSTAAQFLGVSRRSVYVWMAQGRLPYLVTPSGRRKIAAADLLRPASPTPLPGANEAYERLRDRLRAEP
jgi:excisionase family DNA binding protein